jgi:hypothetical protein
MPTGYLCIVHHDTMTAADGLYPRCPEPGCTASPRIVCRPVTLTTRTLALRCGCQILESALGTHTWDPCEAHSPFPQYE